MDKVTRIEALAEALVLVGIAKAEALQLHDSTRNPRLNRTCPAEAEGSTATCQC